MKISTKLISITSILISISLLLAVTVGLFVTQNKLDKISISNKEDAAKNNWEFFKNKNNNSANKINLESRLNKMDILYLFTNFSQDYNSKKLEFNENKIHKNILKFIENTISNFEQFKDIGKYYFRIGYELVNKSLFVDVRWGLKKQIIENKYTELYFSQFIISITE